MAHQKQYGLILSEKTKAKTSPSKKSSKSSNVFGEDSSDEESNVDWVKQSLKKQSHGSMQQKASMKVMKEALEDDPSVYQYDEVYDEMAKKKEETVEKKKADKKPKYIEALLKTAKQRELENELRKEREAQRERENEGDEFADKEAFVTSSFKKKMEEIRKMQDDQEYHDAIDDATDVTKQKDMSGFYRQLYKDTLKDAPNPVDSKIADVEIKKEIEDTSKDVSPNLKSQKSNKSHDRKRSRTPEYKEYSRNDGAPPHDSRRRKRSRSHSGNRDRDMRRRHNSPPSNKSKRDYNRDRDIRDRDVRRSRSLERYERRHHDRRRRSRSRSTGKERDQDRNRRHRSRSPDRHISHDNMDKQRRHGDEETKQAKERKTDKEKASKVVEADIDVDDKIKIIQKENWYDFDVEIERNVKAAFYAKRTVGQVLEDALQRYLERKSINQVVIYK